MLDKEMQDALNKQINMEMYSAYIYLSMSAYFETKSLKGMAAWLRVQYDEEIVHAMKIFDYINERGGRVVLDKIDAPAEDFGSPLKAFETAYSHECKVTGLIHDLVDLAEKKKDRATMVFLQWFVTEQVEEEASTLEIVDKIKLVGERPSDLLLLDEMLGKRKVVGGEDV